MISSLSLKLNHDGYFQIWRPTFLHAIKPRVVVLLQFLRFQ